MPPVLGVPEGEKQAGQRVDFKPNQFDLAIETKGYLLLWERATWCPCAPVTIQTEQPDPNCELCKGQGWTYFGAATSQNISGYELTDLQEQMRQDTGGMIIRGIITSVSNQQNPVDVLSNWLAGTANLTVRAENRIGYYDKATLLDAEIVYSERIVADGTAILDTRYPVICVNQIRTTDSVYKEGTEFDISKGVVTWRDGHIPEADTYISIHYLCHPVYLVVTHPHAARLTSLKFKTSSPKTPTGDPRQLPIQAVIRYDFVPEPS